MADALLPTKVLTADEVTALREDAKNRSARTLIQGLATDVLLSIALVVFNLVSDTKGWDDFDWKAVGFLLTKTVLVTAASYVMRMKTGVLLPPAPQPAPSVPAEEPAADVSEDDYLPKHGESKAPADAGPALTNEDSLMPPEDSQPNPLYVDETEGVEAYPDQSPTLLTDSDRTL